MRCALAAIVAASLVLGPGVASAETCAGNTEAIGTSRTIVVDPREHSRIGSMQYVETLPLAAKEVVLTFDDGPLPQHTGRVLETLAAECVKATFFIVGRMARAYPEWVRKVHDAGHTIGTHTHNHPRYFRRLSADNGVTEIQDGIAATQAALGEGRAPSPFFRFPGFGRTDEAEQFLAANGLMTWGADVPADDWMHLTPQQVIQRAMSRLEQKGRGVLLLHDIQPVTVKALPELLRTLKAAGYRIVHVVAATSERPKTVTQPIAWLFRPARTPGWPDVALTPVQVAGTLPAPSPASFGFPHPLRARLLIPPASGQGEPLVVERESLRVASLRIGKTAWPPLATITAAGELRGASAQALTLSQAFDAPLRLSLPAAPTERRVTPEPSTERAGAPKRPRSARIRSAASGWPQPAREAEPSGFGRLFNWYH
ncbi:MAG TPA: polysaccharide deacetylase family protein [Enterovirga sp.]